MFFSHCWRVVILVLIREIGELSQFSDYKHKFSINLAVIFFASGPKISEVGNDIEKAIPNDVIQRKKKPFSIPVNSVTNIRDKNRPKPKDIINVNIIGSYFFCIFIPILDF